MFFKSSNYTIADHTTDPFKVIHETDKKIQEMSINNEGHIYFTQDNKIHKLKSTKKNKSQDDITCLKIQGDLILSGDIKGNIKIFSKNILIRSYSEHTNAINSLVLYNDKILISGSDDGLVKFYNILETKSYKTFDWIGDRVRTLSICKNFLYIGALNGCISVINLETFEKVKELDTKKGIYNLEVIDKEIFFSASNKIYKITSDIQQIGSHLKLITKMKIFNSKIYTISLDGFFKTWSFDGQLISKIYFSSPILSFDNFDKVFYFGLEIGKICQLGGIQVVEKKKELRNKNIKDYEEEIQYKILEQNISKNTQIEKLIKKYEHKGALKKALDNKDFIEIFGVLYFLQQNRKLKNAILFLEKSYLIDLLDFIIDNFQISVLFELFNELLTILLSVYLEDFTEDDELYERLLFLSDVVDEECLFQEKLIEVYAFLECF